MRDLPLGLVDDPRDRRGRRHTLVAMLRAALLGLMSGCRTLREVEALTGDVAAGVPAALGLSRRISDTALRSTLVRLDPERIREVLRATNRAALRRKSIRPERYALGVLSIDGKCVTTRRPEGPYAQAQGGESSGASVRTMTVTYISSNAFPCLDASPIPAKTNEVAHFRTLFPEIVKAYGAHFDVVMGDAGYLCNENSQLVHEAGKGYVFQVKDNVPTLVAGVAKVLAAGGGRVHTGLAEREDGLWVRRRVTLYDIDPTLDAWDRFQSAKQVAVIERIVVPDESTEEGWNVIGTRSYITNLTKGRFVPNTWLRLLRDRWAVENQNHGTWDNAFEEDDHHWIDQPQGMLVVMLLRRIAYTLLALFRAVTSHAKRHQSLPWRRLFTLVRDALITATTAILQGFRARAPATS